MRAGVLAHYRHARGVLSTALICRRSACGMRNRHTDTQLAELMTLIVELAETAARTVCCTPILQDPSPNEI